MNVATATINASVTIAFVRSVSTRLTYWGTIRISCRWRTRNAATKTINAFLTVFVAVEHVVRNFLSPVKMFVVIRMQIVHLVIVATSYANQKFKQRKILVALTIIIFSVIHLLQLRAFAVYANGQNRLSEVHVVKKATAKPVLFVM